MASRVVASTDSSTASVAPQAGTEQTGLKRGPKPGTPEAKAGGRAVRDKYGSEYFRRIGAKGGAIVRRDHGAEFYATIGRLGGETTHRIFGSEHYQRIGRLGGLRARARARERDAEGGAAPREG